MLYEYLTQKSPTYMFLVHSRLLTLVCALFYVLTVDATCAHSRPCVCVPVYALFYVPTAVDASNLSMLDLEIADYKRTVESLNKKIADMSEQQEQHQAAMQEREGKIAELTSTRAREEELKGKDEQTRLKLKTLLLKTKKELTEKRAETERLDKANRDQLDAVRVGTHAVSLNCKHMRSLKCTCAFSFMCTHLRSLKYTCMISLTCTHMNLLNEHVHTLW